MKAPSPRRAATTHTKPNLHGRERSQNGRLLTKARRETALATEAAWEKSRKKPTPQERHRAATLRRLLHTLWLVDDIDRVIELLHQEKDRLLSEL
jgi:hypothetical protein